MAANTLAASQLGIQVVGNNIANATTPGYVRQELVLAPAPTQRMGNLLFGLGVDVKAVVQKIDRFLEERMRNAAADMANGETQESAYMQLESLIGELSDTDLSTSLNNFFGSIHDILNQPESVSVRNLAVLLGGTLTQDINRLSARVRELRDDANGRISQTADTVNRLLKEVARLNVQIVTVEAGEASASDAVGLRDARSAALMELSKILGTKAVETPTGAVTVFLGGDFLVFEGNHRTVEAVIDQTDPLGAAEIRVVDTAATIRPATGEYAGLLAVRDDILGGFHRQLDSFTQALIFEFNKLYTSGQGLRGYTELVGEFGVRDIDAALDQAGLPFTPVNGSFQVQVLNKQTGLTQVTDVFVPLNGMEDDLTLSQLAGLLDQIDGITATITPQRQLEIRADSPLVEFAFAQDTSGVLAALGVGAFFTGYSAVNIGVSDVVRADPARFAASRGGIGRDTANAIEMARFLDRPLDTRDGANLAVLYDRLVGEATQSAAVSRAVADGFRVFYQTLEGQFMAISGVSMDEEAVKMLMYQRMFQASARFIQTVGEMLDLLVRL